MCVFLFEFTGPLNSIRTHDIVREVSKGRGREYCTKTEFRKNSQLLREVNNDKRPKIGVGKMCF